MASCRPPNSLGKRCFACRSPTTDGDEEGAIAVRFFAGQPDPADASYFTIGYAVDGVSGTINGWLGDDERVKLQVRDGPAKMHWLAGADARNSCTSLRAVLMTKFNPKEMPITPLDGSFFFRVYEETTIKDKNQKWQLRLGDPDPLPSCPHAHLVGRNLKLDLSTGDLYRGGKFTGDWLNRKELLAIRGKFEKRGDELPPLKGRTS